MELILRYPSQVINEQYACYCKLWPQLSTPPVSDDQGEPFILRVKFFRFFSQSVDPEVIGFQRSRIVARHDLYASASDVLHEMFSTMEQRLPDGLLNAAGPGVCSYLREVTESPGFPDIRVSCIEVYVYLVYYTRLAVLSEDEDELEWAVRESEEEIRVVPASRASIEALEEVKIGGQDRVRVRANEACDYACTICLEELFVESTKLLSMPCSHVFHENCIVQWLQTSHLCPLCRYAMPTE